MVERVVYILPQIDRIGQLVVEASCLKNLYAPDEHELVVVTPVPESKPKLNRAVFDIAMRDLTLVHTGDDSIIWYTHQNRDLQPVEIDGTLYFLDSSKMLDRFFEKYATADRFDYYFSLNDEENARGAAITQAFGIPDDAKIVTLHVREPGYLPEFAYHSYRDATIEHYLPAIQYLLDEGYYVVRLGDDKMTPMSGIVGANAERCIDAVFHPAYEGLVDPYCMSRSEFFFGTTSGPFDLARAFGVPIFSVNTPIQHDLSGFPGDLYVPKRYVRVKDEYVLSYREVIESKLLDTFRAEEFDALGVRLEENSPEELLAATKEMVARVRGQFRSDAELARYREWVKGAERQANDQRREEGRPSVLRHPETRSEISVSYIEANPRFLA